jgi:hypothetical protein
MRLPSGEQSALHDLAGVDLAPQETDRQLPVQPHLHGAAACLGQHLPLAEQIPHRGARTERPPGHFVTQEDALNSEIDQRTEVI